MKLFTFGRKKVKKVLSREEKLRYWSLELIKLSVLAMVISPANSWLTNFLLFHPDKISAADAQTIKTLKEKYNLTWTDAYFPSKSGEKLHGWYITQPGAKKTFLVSHGNAGNLAHRLPLVDAFAACGCSMLLYDYQGYGGSDGEPTPEGIIADGIGAYDYLVKAKQVAAQDVVLYGESLGCAVSTAISRERPVDGIVLQSGFATITETSRRYLPWFRLYPDEVFPQRFLENITAYKTKHPPLLLLHGTNDFILSSAYSQEIFEAAIEPKQLVLLPNCSHNDVFGESKEVATKSINGFVKELISQTVANKKLPDVIVQTAAITNQNLPAAKAQ